MTKTRSIYSACDFWTGTGIASCE